MHTLARKQRGLARRKRFARDIDGNLAGIQGALDKRAREERRAVLKIPGRDAVARCLVAETDHLRISVEVGQWRASDHEELGPGDQGQGGDHVGHALAGHEPAHRDEP